MVLKNYDLLTFILIFFKLAFEQSIVYLCNCGVISALQSKDVVILSTAWNKRSSECK